MDSGAQGYNRNPGGRKGVCFQCEKRQPGCHAKCEDYLKERGNWEDRLKKRMQEATIDNYQADRAFKLHKRSGKSITDTQLTTGILSPTKKEPGGAIHPVVVAA